MKSKNLNHRGHRGFRLSGFNQHDFIGFRPELVGTVRTGNGNCSEVNLSSAEPLQSPSEFRLGFEIFEGLAGHLFLATISQQLRRIF